MTLVDTSVWIEHLRIGNRTLSWLLDEGSVLIHPFVIGEIALGHLLSRDIVLTTLRKLPIVDVATDYEVLGFIDRRGLFGLGIGYVDAHLLAAIALMPGTWLWTLDKRLLRGADRCGIPTGFPPR